MNSRDTEREFTLEDIANGKSYSICLVSIFGNVYNIAKFLPIHPGGENVLLKASGKILDDVFEDGNHKNLKNTVSTMLAKYKVGILKK